MGNIYKGNAHLLLDTLQLVLHILAQTQIQCAQRLVQKQHLRPVHQGSGDGHPLLLAAGKLIHAPLFKALQTHDAQHFRDTLTDLRFRHLGNAQAESNVFKHVQMREQRILLEHRVDLPLVRRDIIDPDAVKDHVAAGGGGEPADDAQRGGLAAAAGA